MKTKKISLPGKSGIKGMLKDKSGTSIIVVTIVMAIVAFVCLSLLLVSYQMVSSANDDALNDRYYRQAESLSNVIKLRLTSGKNPEKNTIEEFIYEFMSDNVNYPVTADIASNVEFTADEPEGDTADGYLGMSVRLKKELASGTEDEENASSNNGWSERKEYHCTIKVSALVDDEKVSTVTQRHLFYLADSSYKYYSMDDEGNKTYYELDATDNEYIIVNGKDVKIASLQNSKGSYNDGSTDFIIYRELDSNNTSYKFEFIGYY
ncbi:MAG: hypothetical protein K6F77_00870 [Lachnospiraceae bacterium]|nr:hypothetical protein [Lachnospiraceae bacterium]